MRRFEISIISSQTSTAGGLDRLGDRIMYLIPEEASTLLEPILGAYGQDPNWYFDKLNYGRPPAPWAVVCLDREYAIAGHVATCRPAGAGIGFTVYTTMPSPVPENYAPRVGCFILQGKDGIERAANCSPVFATIWDALRECAVDRRWLVLLDPLPQDWLSEILPSDADLWRSYRNGG